ncbi:hypothetical protein DAPPUDRAFT_41519 [Daphnia pulex]|uniref:Large ribosomal subunit protein mL38 n=1 Tax=Daphnia pulex TaxID=6669 RepID=E9FW29_DAPPU|nr:hypothetical protein DAPPUDRAFT_41519 [Daphnia pulex]|eukprot:EFX88649.1 hypothetical protein DAPPUDRAFT_41519 [Daphnia pulex]
MSNLINQFKFARNLLLKLQPVYIQPNRELRGKAPDVARTLKQRLEGTDMFDPSLHFKVNIGLPHLKTSKAEENGPRLKMQQSIKKSAEASSIEEISLKEIRKEWLKTAAPFQIKAIAEHYNIFKDLFGEAFFVPRIPISIGYQQTDGSTMPVYFGNQIKPYEAVLPPIVSYEADPSSLWTLVLTNPDGHLSEKDAEYVHWFIGNIPGNNIDKGDEVVSYLQPFPPRGTGSQRLVFVLYKQEKQIDFSSYQRTTPCLELTNRTFHMKRFYKEFQDYITPAGLSFFQSDWDISLTDFFHKTLNMKEPIYEFDFPEPYKKPPIWFPKKQPFNLYMDKHRDQKQISKELLLKRLKTVDPFKPKEPEYKYPNALPENNNLPSWLRVEIRKQRLKWGRYNDM